jgi:hypothetical protein
MAREIECVSGQIAERVTLPLNPVLARAGMDCQALLVATVGRRSTGYKLDASKLL